jgi:hypothetical protein
LLVNPYNPPSATEGKAVEAAAAAIGQPFHIFNASTGSQIDDAFAAMASHGIGALIVGSDPLFFIERIGPAGAVANQAAGLGLLSHRPATGC